MTEISEARIERTPSPPFKLRTPPPLPSIPLDILRYTCYNTRSFVTKANPMPKPRRSPIAAQSHSARMAARRVRRAADHEAHLTDLRARAESQFRFAALYPKGVSVSQPQDLPND